MTLQFWGTRGSIPTFNDATQIYGGNTSCVSLVDQGTLIIFDAGSGIKRLTDSEYIKGFKEFHILLTHMHFDHIQGLGFFGPFFNPENKVNIYGPAINSEELIKTLSKYLSPPLFPVRIRDFKADVQFHALPKRSLKIDHLSVSSAYLCHPGPTLGYRINNEQTTLCYIPDHEVALGVPSFPKSTTWTSGFDLAADTDLLIHDAQYSNQEYQAKIGWGHSSFNQAIRFGELCRTKKLFLFHHDPAHSDQQLEELLAEQSPASRNFEINLAKEGDRIELN